MVLTGCIGIRDYIVESDYSYSGNFKRYKTYTFFDYYKFDKDSLMPDDLIRETIQNRMRLLGYKEDAKNPSILVGYKMFFRDFKFKGYNQPELEEWLKAQEYFEETYEPIKYKFLEGTMFIFFN